MSEQPIGHPSRGAERRLFDMVMAEGGTFAVSRDGRYHAACPMERPGAVCWISYAQSFNPAGPSVPKEPDGATLTERLLMRLVTDQEVYWRNRDRRERVRRQRRGKANEGGE